MTGDVQFICDNDLLNLTYFVADCGEYDGNITCDCCTFCCKEVENEKGCNAGDLLDNENLNFQTVREYHREQFVFSENIVFVEKPSGNGGN